MLRSWLLPVFAAFTVQGVGLSWGCLAANSNQKRPEVNIQNVFLVEAGAISGSSCGLYTKVQYS